MGYIIIFMKENEEEIQFLENHIPEMAEAAVKQAYWQALSSGYSVLFSDNGVIKEIFPDGSIEVKMESEPYIKTQPGKVIKIK